MHSRNICGWKSVLYLGGRGKTIRISSNILKVIYFVSPTSAEATARISIEFWTGGTHGFLLGIVSFTTTCYTSTSRV